MIMLNDKTNFENEKNETKRIFTSILEAVKPYIDIFDPDYENNTARGLLKTCCAAHTTTLTYDPDEKIFAMVIHFHVDNDWPMPKIMILLRLQNYTAMGLSSINLDTESYILKVESHASLPAFNVVQPVVTTAVKNSIHVLEDDDFRSFIN